MCLPELPVCPPGSPVPQWDWTGVTALPLSSLGCHLSACWALKGPWGQDGDPGIMPSLSFCKSKAALCPSDWPLWPLPHLWPLLQAVSGTHSSLPPALAALRCCCCFIPLLLHDKSHHYCRLTYRAVKKEMGISTLVSHSWYFQLQMENRMSRVMMLCHCLGQWIRAVCSCSHSCSQWPCPVSVAGLRSWVFPP